MSNLTAKALGLEKLKNVPLWDEARELPCEDCSRRPLLPGGRMGSHGLSLIRRNLGPVPKSSSLPSEARSCSSKSDNLAPLASAGGENTHAGAAVRLVPWRTLWPLVRGCLNESFGFSRTGRGQPTPSLSDGRSAPVLSGSAFCSLFASMAPVAGPLLREPALAPSASARSSSSSPH